MYFYFDQLWSGDSSEFAVLARHEGDEGLITIFRSDAAARTLTAILNHAARSLEEKV